MEDRTKGADECPTQNPGVHPDCCDPADEEFVRPSHNKIAQLRQAARSFLSDLTGPELRPESRAAKRRYSRNRGAYFKQIHMKKQNRVLMSSKIE